jgi:general secretion pathway protein D
VKIIILTVLLTGGSLLAQAPASGDEDAARTELLRQAMRQKIAETRPDVMNTNFPPVAASPPTVNVIAPNVAAELVAPGIRTLPSTNAASPVAASAQPAGALVLPPAFPVIPAATTVAVPGPAAPPPGILPPVAGAPATPPTTPPPVAAVAPPAAPTPPAAKPAEVTLPVESINFPDVSIDQILEFYGKLVGRTILRPATLPAGTINLKAETPLTTSEAIQALESVLYMNGISTVNQGEKFVKVVPASQAGVEAERFNTDDPKDLPESGHFTTQVVQLQYVKPSDVQQLLASFSKIPNSITPIDANQTLIIRDTAETIKRMLELIKQVDIAVPSEFDSEVIPIKYAKVEDIASALNSLGAGTSASVGGGGRGAAPGLPGNRGGAPGQLGGQAPGTPGYRPPTGAVTPPATATSLQQRLQSIVNKAQGSTEFQIIGQTKIIADSRMNSLLVYANKEDMATIKKIISQLDRILAQVLIQSIIMEVTLSDDQTLGLSYLQSSPPTAPGGYFSGSIGAIKNGTFLNGGNFASSAATNAAAGLPGGLSYFANFGSDFQATLTAIADTHKINVLSEPSIQTSHAVKAEIKIGNTVPYVTGTYFNGVSGTPNSQYSQTFVGITLDVTPYINQDGLVVMEINQDIEQLGTSTLIDGNEVPQTTQRSAFATVSVRNGDTIMLGGFISSSKTKDKSGVPLLMNIPVLGYLFRSTADTSQRVELIVLIRPTVLPNPEDAALTATLQRNRMPGVRAAQQDFDQDQAVRIKAGDRRQADIDAAAAKAKQ